LTTPVSVALSRVTPVAAPVSASGAMWPAVVKVRSALIV
jgi:hypothetical protein